MIRILIIDDEPIARQIVRTYAEKCGFLEVIAECETALETLPYLQQGNIDAFFMDINMPGVDGLSFMKALSEKPKVIFTTAYKDFALDAFEIKATDYLLKPFSYQRFLTAAERLQNANNQEITSENNYIVIKNGKALHRIFFEDLLYCEAQLNYVRFVTNEGEIVAYQTLTDTEKLLPNTLFVRSHRSFLVNKNKVKTIDGNQIIFDKKYTAMIGGSYRDTFLELIGM